MILTDNWFGALAIQAKEYMIFIGIISSFLWAVFKTIAIKHPAIQDNKIVTLWKAWLFGMPIIGEVLKKEDEKNAQ